MNRKVCRIAGMMKQAVFLLGCAVLLLSGCSALRPLPEPAKAQQRQLQGVDNIESVNWGNFECSGMDDIGFSTNYKALDVPEHGVIMGQVKIHNRGVQPFEFRTPGFRLTGAAGWLDSAMKCPDNQVPAGGVMQCGFAAPAMDSLQFDSFQPFFVPKRSAFPCFCQQPFGIEPFVTFDESPIRSFADAAAKAFGGPTLDETLQKLDYWKGNALGLAEDIVNSLFGSIANSGFEFSANLGGNSLEITTGPPRRTTPVAGAINPRFPDSRAAEQPASGKPSAPDASSSDKTPLPEKRSDAPSTATGKDAATTAPTQQPADIPASTPVSTPASAPASTPVPASATPTLTAAPTTGTPASPVNTPVDGAVKTPTETPAPVNTPTVKTPSQTPAPTSTSTPAAAPIQGADSKAAPVVPAIQPKPAEPTPAKAVNTVPAVETKPADKAPTTPAPVANSGSGKAPQEQQPAVAAPVANKPITNAAPSTPAPVSKETPAKEQPATAAPVANKPATTAGPSTPAPESKDAAAVKPGNTTGAAAKEVPAASGASTDKTPAAKAPQPAGKP